VFDYENGQQLTLETNTPESMNFWGFTPDYFNYSKREFVKFLNEKINVPKSEFYIPTAIDALIRSGEASVKVLDTDSRWFGVTYPEDRPGVVANLAALHAAGEYPDKMF
ncbi:MAG: nucleotidyltransferase, partial [Muribaculaceae bacterium]|nr:nucleotidyltransferase [Muribaculaceae bacterium]